VKGGMMPQPTISCFFSCLFMMAFLLFLRHKKTIKEMCKYTDIEAVELPNGKHEVTDNPP
jgi:hypothetical protein